jgi:hypothetical protein
LKKSLSQKYLIFFIDKEKVRLKKKISQIPSKLIDGVTHAGNNILAVLSYTV